MIVRILSISAPALVALTIWAVFGTSFVLLARKSADDLQSRSLTGKLYFQDAGK